MKNSLNWLGWLGLMFLLAGATGLSGAEAAEAAGNATEPALPRGMLSHTRRVTMGMMRAMHMLITAWKARV